MDRRRAALGMGGSGRGRHFARPVDRRRVDRRTVQHLASGEPAAQHGRRCGCVPRRAPGRDRLGGGHRSCAAHGRGQGSGVRPRPRTGYSGHRDCVGRAAVSQWMPASCRWHGAIAALDHGPAEVVAAHGSAADRPRGLTEGSAADLVVFDRSDRWQVSPESLLSKGKNSPLLGRELPGRVLPDDCRRAAGVRGSGRPTRANRPSHRPVPSRRRRTGRVLPSRNANSGHRRVLSADSGKSCEARYGASGAGCLAQTISQCGGLTLRLRSTCAARRQPTRKHS